MQILTVERDYYPTPRNEIDFQGPKLGGVGLDRRLNSTKHKVILTSGQRPSHAEN